MPSAVVQAIKALVEDGVLGEELCPNQDYWHWPVIRPEDLPEWIEPNYKKYGEIRHYWH